MHGIIVTIVPSAIVHELVVTIPLVVLPYDWGIKIVIPNTKMHEFIVLKSMTSKHMKDLPSEELEI
jgi:hypothetical protein